MIKPLPGKGSYKFEAEGKGFEPLIGFLLYTLSRRASSTTPAPLREAAKISVPNLAGEYFFSVCGCPNGNFFRAYALNFG